jgi:integrase/recombinase XerD
VPVAQLFSWLRREHRIAVNPAADLLMPRPDRRLPEGTLSVAEMATLLSRPDVSSPLGLRDRAVLEVFYSCGIRRAELISLWLRDVEFERGTVFEDVPSSVELRWRPSDVQAASSLLYSIGVTPRST